MPSNEVIKLQESTSLIQNLGLSEGLAIALLSAIFGLIGVFIAKYYERKQERRAFLRIKFEDLVFRLIDFTTQIKESQANYFQSKERSSLDISQFSKDGGKIEVLVILYFPELEVICKHFLQAGLNLCVAQRSYELNDNDEQLSRLAQRQKEFDDIYDNFYSQIKACIPKYT